MSSWFLSQFYYIYDTTQTKAYFNRPMYPKMCVRGSVSFVFSSFEKNKYAIFIVTWILQTFLFIFLELPNLY